LKSLFIAQEAMAFGVVAATKNEKVAWYETALEVSREAVSLDSMHAEANYWMAASLGLLSDVHGGRT
jgi:hypothetical protein